MALSARVPPGGVVDHGIGGGKIELDGAGLEADQEQWHFARLEPCDSPNAVRCVTSYDLWDEREGMANKLAFVVANGINQFIMRSVSLWLVLPGRSHFVPSETP